MKKNLPITQKEVIYNHSITITSSTDPKGIITYVNEDFLTISGYDKQELINKNHNIVRHPHMPQEAFSDLWNTLKNGQPWMGIVKNRCKNGDYYWVDAFVTPMKDHNKVIGYESVRIKPDPETIKRADLLYEKLNANKKVISLITGLSISTKLLISKFITSLFVFSSLWFSLDLPITVAFLCFGFTIILEFIFTIYFLKPLHGLAVESKKIVDNPIMQYIYTGNSNEVGQLSLVIKFLGAKLRTILRRLIQSSDTLQKEAKNTNCAIKQMQDAMDNQLKETEMVASAMYQMSATINSIAHNASEAAKSASDANEICQKTKMDVDDTICFMNDLSSHLEATESSVLTLASYSKNIDGVLEVIQSIAEQTNLLALNAAIEAARAGDRGRGFAVVADEVRTLAGHTHDSTETIKNMIERLQSSTEKIVSEISEVRNLAIKGVERGKYSNQLINETTSAVSTISEMTFQIASAAEEQHMVSEEVSRNLENIDALSRQTADYTHTARGICDKMKNLAFELNSLIERFNDN